MRVPFPFSPLFAIVLQPRHLLLPLLLVMVLATGISFLPRTAALTGRWIVVALLAVQVLLGRRSLNGITPALMMALAGYVGWCALTAAWSVLPALSWPKAAALAVTSFAALGAGQQWVLDHRRDQLLGFLGPPAALSLAAGVFSSDRAFAAGSLILHAGATTNPNFLGAIVAMSLPFVVWRLHRHRGRRAVGTLWGLVLFGYLLMLYLTASRGSYLIVIGMAAGLLLAMKPRRIIMFALCALWTAGLITVVVPDVAGAWVQRNVYKQADSDLGVFYRRLEVWSDSYDAAVAGGLTGVGTGISIGGDASQIDSLFTAHHYSREKGSSQLAIVEETGLVGFGLYLVLMAVLFRQLLAGFWRSPRSELRILRGIVVGTLAGLLLQSFLEAWWVGPGSPEFIFFWVLAGTGLALARAARAESGIARSRSGSAQGAERAMAPSVVAT